MFRRIIGDFFTWASATYRGANCLTIAAFKNNFKEVEKYLKKGYGIDQRDRFGGTALMCVAAKRNSGKMVKYLLEKGANPDLVDDKGRNALLFAVKYGRDVESIKILIEKTADVKIVDETNNTLLNLELLSESTDFDVVKMLIDAGVDLKIRSDEGNTADILCVGQNIDINITALVLQASNPDAKIEVVDRGHSVFIVSSKNGKLDGFFVKYIEFMDRYLMIQGYIFYKENERQMARCFVYEKGEISNSLLGGYNEGKLFCVGTKRENMQLLNEQNKKAIEIFNELTCEVEYVEGGLSVIDLEPIIIDLLKE